MHMAQFFRWKNIQVVKVDNIKECKAKKTLQNNDGENEKKHSPGPFLFFKHKL